MTPRRRCFGPTLVGLLMAATGGLAAADAPSEAEVLLFNAPHLAPLKPPTQLQYRYEETAAGQPPAHDVVRMQLWPDAQGACCAVSGEFLTGARAISLPDIEAARANPVLLYFLEFEVRRLARETGGNANHFRRRIREALVTATVSPARLTWQGSELPAREVEIAPYETDPFRDRFAAQARTRYRFLLADEVPGGLFELSATVPGRGAGIPPQRIDRLTLIPQTAAATAKARLP